MFKLLMGTALAAILAGCVQLPPSPQDIEAKKFERTPGKAVIYLARASLDVGDAAATLWLDDQMMGTTYPGTYFRWEVAPGRHRIAGFGADTGVITLDVQADRTYFVQQAVRGGGRVTNAQSFFRVIDESRGRKLVLEGVLTGQF